MAAKGIDFYLYNDAVLLNPDEQSSTFNVVKKVNKRRYEEETYKDVYDTFLFMTPAKTKSVLSTFIKSYTKNGVDNLALTGITNKLYSYTYNGEKYTRYDTKASYKEIVEATAQNTNLILEQPSAYLWGSTKAFLDMPLYTSSYIYEDESVPFLSIVLKGIMPVYSEYINFEANKKEMFLKMVETGIFPSFYITKESSSELIYTNSSDVYSSEYSSYKETIKEYSEELKTLDNYINGATIKGHEINKDVVKVTYSNGVKVYINYGATATTLDNVKIDSMSYEVVNG